MKKLLLLVLPVFAILIQNQKANAQACPNGDFENWNVKAYSEPDSGWYDSNPKTLSQDDSLTVWQVIGQTGQAIHIETAIIGTDTLQAYITNSASDPTQGQGGVPYSQMATAITGYYRYNIATGDSAGILVIFKKSGSIISQNIYKIGGSQSSFTAFNLPIQVALTQAPDSVIVAATSSNIISNIGVQGGSWIELDQLALTSSTFQNLPGGSFNLWTPDTLFTPVGWAAEQHGDGSGITRSANNWTGNYSVELVSQANNDGNSGASPGEITTGYFTPDSGARGGLPYTLTTDTLTGWYLYTPAGTDTGNINIQLSAAGVPVGGNSYNFLTASSWTLFSMPFSAGSTPDTMRIDITSGSYHATTPGSILYIDDIQLSSNPLSVKGVTATAPKIFAYPNPANDMFSIRLSNITGSVNARIYDVTGRTIATKGYDAAPGMISFSVKNLASGLYFYEVTSNGNVTTNKFTKQ